MKPVWWLNGALWMAQGLMFVFYAYVPAWAIFCFVVSVGAVIYADKLDNYNYRR